MKPDINIFLFKPTIHKVPSAAPRINTAVPRSGCLKIIKKELKLKLPALTMKVTYWYF